ncbi:MAG TPA: hypothetical protein PLS60_10805 [Arenimonas sp.]|nr:hypothetical protein [Arenimonas sp.]
MSIFIASKISHPHPAEHADSPCDWRLKQGCIMKYPFLLLALSFGANFARAETLAPNQGLPEGLQYGAAMASVGLEETAEDQGINPDKAGAVLLLWNYPACDVYNEIHESGADADMSERQIERLQQKCRKVISLKPAAHTTYIKAAIAAKNDDTSAISLAWAGLVADKSTTRILVMDDKNSCFITTPGYSEFIENNARYSCRETAWDSQVATETSAMVNL